MDNQTDSRALAIKLGELYESCLIREKAKGLSTGYLGNYLSDRWRKNDVNIETCKKLRKSHQASYDRNKPQPSIEPQQQYDPKQDIEQERVGKILAFERPHYKPWLLLSAIVTLLCGLVACVIAFMLIRQEHPAAIPAFSVCIIAYAVKIFLLVCMDPRCGISSNTDRPPSNAISNIVFAILAIVLFQWKLYLLLGIAAVNAVLTTVLIGRASAKCQKKAKADPMIAALYTPADYTPSSELQKKIDERLQAENAAYNAELAEYDKQFYAKLSEMDAEIARMEKELEEDHQQAKAAHTADLEQVQKVLPAADKVWEEADFLQPEDKTSDCVWFLYQEMSSGRAASLKQALIAYDEHKANNRDALAQLDLITNISKRSAAVRQKAQEDEERVRLMRAQNAALAREISEQESRINRELKNS